MAPRYGIQPFEAPPAISRQRRDGRPAMTAPAAIRDRLTTDTRGERGPTQALDDADRLRCGDDGDQSRDVNSAAPSGDGPRRGCVQKTQSVWLSVQRTRSAARRVARTVPCTVRDTRVRPLERVVRKRASNVAGCGRDVSARLIRVDRCWGARTLGATTSGAKRVVVERRTAELVIWHRRRDEPSRSRPLLPRSKVPGEIAHWLSAAILEHRMEFVTSGPRSAPQLRGRRAVCGRRSSARARSSHPPGWQRVVWSNRKASHPSCPALSNAHVQRRAAWRAPCVLVARGVTRECVRWNGLLDRR